ncbi:MAG: tetratricopeptide repeat protein [Phycisphaerales bacterium]
MVIGYCAIAAAAMAQDRVTVTRDDKTITLSNGLVEVVVDRVERPKILRMYWMDGNGRKVEIPVWGSFTGSPFFTGKKFGPVLRSIRCLVSEHDDGSATVVTLTGFGIYSRAATYLRMQPHIAAITWGERIENMRTETTAGIAMWRFSVSQPQAANKTPLSGAKGWYAKNADVNVMFTPGPDESRMWSHTPSSSWLDIGTEGLQLPAYSSFTSQITLGIASGVGPVSAASDSAAISAAKDADGKWMIAVAPFGRLIHAEITVTAGLKTYRQTVNAGPREPFVVETPLTDEKIAVELKAAGGRVLLRSPPEVAPPPEVGKSEAAKVDMEQISKQRVERMNAVLKAMADKNYDAALTLARQMSGPIDGGLTGDVLWVRLMQVLAEQQAGHKDEAEKMLRQWVADDPSAAEAWWLLGDEERAGALGDVKAIRMTMDALRAGRLPR